MQAAATLTSKGQVTIPKAVRDALGLATGDSVVFHVKDGRAIIHPVPDFIDLAGSVAIPDAVSELAGEDVRTAAWRERGEEIG